jgi:hypothetical protein
MSGVITQRDRLSVRRAQSALCAENQKLLSAQFLRIPAHASILGESENISARLTQQHFGVEGKLARRTLCFGADLVNVRGRRGENIALVHDLIEPAPHAGTRGKRLKQARTEFSQKATKEDLCFLCFLGVKIPFLPSVALWFIFLGKFFYPGLSWIMLDYPGLRWITLDDPPRRAGNMLD